MDDLHPVPSLADDPAFLERLDHLDHGLHDQAPRQAQGQLKPPVLPQERVAPSSGEPAPPTRSLQAAAPVAPPARVAVPTSEGASRPAHARRPLLDLFPPPGTVPPGRLRTFQVVPPARVEAPRPRHAPVAFESVAGPATVETFYGLREKAFSQAPDLRFTFHSGSHDRVAQKMLTAIGRRDRVVVLSGGAGVGKTMAYRAVVEQLDRRTLTSVVTEPLASPEDLLKTLLADFGVASRDDLVGGRLTGASRQEFAAPLREFLGTLGSLQAFAVVILDDAQNLSADVLAELGSLVSTGAEAPLLQVVLVGDRRLTLALARPEAQALADAVTVRCELDPLERDEVLNYIVHRLAVAGDQVRVEFDPPAVERIWSLSRGVPRLINEICDRALARAFASSSAIVEEAMIADAVADLGLSVESARSLLVRATIAVAMLLALAVAGAAVAAYALEDRITQLETRWVAMPAPPRPPASTTAAPVAPLVVPDVSSR